MTGKRTNERIAGDFAIAQLNDLAKLLRADAKRPPGQRRMLGTSQVILELAAGILEHVAVGDDGRELIDWRKKEMPMLRAVEEVNAAAWSDDPRVTGWDDAKKLAAKNLRVSLRTIQRHWTAWLKRRGVTEDDVLFPCPNKPKYKRRRLI